MKERTAEEVFICPTPVTGPSEKGAEEGKKKHQWQEEE